MYSRGESVEGHVEIYCSVERGCSVEGHVEIGCSVERGCSVEGHVETVCRVTHRERGCCDISLCVSRVRSHTGWP